MTQQEWQEAVIERLTRIEENSKVIPKLSDRVDTLEASHNKVKGAIGVISVVGSIATSVLGWHLGKGGK